MSFCTKVSNYCRNAYNACSTRAANAYKAVEVRVFTFPVVGQSAQNLKAALLTIPTFLRQMADAGSHQNTARKGALEGANTGVGVATSASKIADLIPLASGTLVGTGAAREGRANGGEIILLSGLATSGLIWSICTRIYSEGLMSGAIPYAYWTLAGVVTVFSLDARNEERNPRLYRIAGLTAGVCSAYLGSTPMESGIISGLLMAAKSSLDNENRAFVLLVKTSLVTGSSVAGFAVAGPLGAAGIGGVVGACFASIENMFRYDHLYLTNVSDHFHEERDEIRRSGQLTLLAQHHFPTPIAKLITEYTE